MIDGSDARLVRFLPDAPLSDATELAFIDGRTFVNATKHEEVVGHHVAENKRLRQIVESVQSKTALDVVAEKLQAQDDLRKANAEVERLRAAPMYGPEGRWTQLRQERDDALTEVERLREHADALAEWVELLNGLVSNPSSPAAFAVQRYRALDMSGRLA